METNDITPPVEADRALDSILTALAAHGFGLPGASPRGNRNALATALVDAHRNEGIRVRIDDDSAR